MTWDPNRPFGNQPGSVGDDAIQANNAWLEAALQQEHYFPENADTTKRGRHKFGLGTTAARDAAITSPQLGNIWFNTDLGQPFVCQLYDGSNWVTLDGGAQVGSLIWMTGDTAPVGGTDPPAAGDLWGPAWDGDEVNVADFGTLATYYGATGGGGGSSPWDNFRGQANPAAGKFRLPKLSKQIIYVGDPADGDYDAAGDRPSTVDEQTLVEANIPLYDPATTSNGKVAISEDKRHDADFGASGTVVNDVNTEAYDPGDFGQATPDPVDTRQQGVVLWPWVRLQ